MKNKTVTAAHEMIRTRKTVRISDLSAVVCAAEKWARNPAQAAHRQAHVEALAWLLIKRGYLMLPDENGSYAVTAKAAGYGKREAAM